MQYVDPNLTYFIIPLPIFNKLNELTPQSPVISGPMSSFMNAGAVVLQSIRVAKPFRLRVFKSGRIDLENVVILDETKGLTKPIWVADAPDPAEVSAEHPFFIQISDMIKKGHAKARYKAYIENAEKIRVCGMDEPIGEVLCIPSGYWEEVQPGSVVEGTVILEIWPRNAFV